MDINTITDKIKKLTEALYRVTELYPDQEPLKWALRDNAVFLYTNIIQFILPGPNKSHKKFEEIMGHFSGIINTLDLASLGGFISDVNFEILKKEYSILKDIINGEKDNLLKDKKFLIPSDLSKPKGPARLASALVGVAGRQIHNGQPIGQSNGPARLASESVTGRHNKSNNRQEMIINFLKNNGKKTISEISLNFEGISNKSIQRDVLSLVERGVLGAEGEKRWRVYFLTKNAL